MINNYTSYHCFFSQLVARYLLILFSLLPSIVFAQQAPLFSASFEQTTLADALAELESQHQLTFSYDAQLLGSRQVTASFEKLPIDAVLSLLLSDGDLSFRVIDTEHILIRREVSTEEAVDVSTTMICGQVYDALSREGLEFATVLLPKQSKGISTQAEGDFRLMVKLTKEEVVEISFVGYEKQSWPLRKFASGDCPKIYLQPETAMLTGVIVTDENQRGFSRTQKEPVQTIRPAKLKNLPGQPVPDVMRLVQLLPGVSSSNESASGLHVRGGRADQNLILFDGISVFHEGHFFGLVSAFNSEVANRVEVHKRGFSPRYGGRLSSVIDIKSKDFLGTRPEASVGLNLLYGQAHLALPIIPNKLSLLVGGRKSTNALWTSPTNNRMLQQIFQEGRIFDDQQLENEAADTLFPNYNFDDVNLKLNWAVNEQNQFSLSYLRMGDQLSYFTGTSGDKTSSDSISLLNAGLSATWKTQWSKAWTSQANLSQSNYDFYFLYLDDITEERLDIFNRQGNQLRETNFTLENHWRQDDRHTLHFGYQYFRYQFQRQNYFFDSFLEDEYFTEEGQSKLHVLFGNYHFSLADLLQLSLGLRYNYYVPTQQHLIEPRFRANLQIDPHWQLEMNAGRYYQFVGQVISGDGLNGEEHNWVVAQSSDNVGIEPTPMQGEHFSVSAFWKKNGMEISLEAYQKWMRGLNSFAVRFGEYVSAYNPGEGDSQGLEFLIQKQWRDWQLLSSYTLSKTRYTFLYWEDGRYFPASHDQRHLWHVLGNWTPGNWELGLRWSIGSGLPYTLPERLIYPPGATDPATRIIEYGPQNAERLPAYHRLDGSINYHFSAKKEQGWKMTIGLSFLNLYNRRNLLDRRSIHTYTWDQNIEEVVVGIKDIDKYGLPFTPNLTWRIELR